MRFRPGASLDPSEVQDRRGVGGIGAGGLTIGGGGLGVVVLVIYLVISALGGGSAGALSNLDGTSVGQQPASQVLGQECVTGADANTKEDCRIVAVVDSVQKYWKVRVRCDRQDVHGHPDRLLHGLDRHGLRRRHHRRRAVLLPDRQARLYRPWSFFDQLRSQFGATGGPFAEAYVIAHEYGHHVQDLLGKLGKGTSGKGAEGQSVRTELQADCYAGGLGAQRDDDRPDRGSHAGRHRRRAQRRCSGRRRPDPVRDPGPRRPRDVGRTAHPPSGSTGSRSATAAGSRAPATRARERSELERAGVGRERPCLRRGEPARGGERLHCLLVGR